MVFGDVCGEPSSEFAVGEVEKFSGTGEVSERVKEERGRQLVNARPRVLIAVVATLITRSEGLSRGAKWG